MSSPQTENKISKPRPLDPAILINGGPFDELDARCRDFDRDVLSKRKPRFWLTVNTSIIFLLSIFALIFFVQIIDIHEIEAKEVFLISISIGLIISFIQTIFFRYENPEIKNLTFLIILRAFAVAAFLTAWLKAEIFSFPIQAIVFVLFLVFFVFANMGFPHYKISKRFRKMVGRPDPNSLKFFFAETFGFTWSYEEQSFPENNFAFFLNFYDNTQIPHHLSGIWRNFRFHAGALCGDEQSDFCRLIIRIDNFIENEFVFGMCSMGEFGNYHDDGFKRRFHMDEEGFKSEFICNNAEIESAMVDYSTTILRSMYRDFAQLEGAILVENRTIVLIANFQILDDPVADYSYFHERDAIFQVVENELVQILRLVELLIGERKRMSLFAG